MCITNLCIPKILFLWEVNYSVYVRHVKQGNVIVMCTVQDRLNL